MNYAYLLVDDEVILVADDDLTRALVAVGHYCNQIAHSSRWNK